MDDLFWEMEKTIVHFILNHISTLLAFVILLNFDFVGNQYEKLIFNFFILYNKMNFNELLTVVFNNDTAIALKKKKNMVKTSEICESCQIMFIKESRWCCQKRSCRKEKSLRVNNWLTGSRLPTNIDTIVHFVYYWAREMSSVTFCKHELKMRQNAVVD
jgi:hypothetical protein